jgi:hypothetical protein
MDISLQAAEPTFTRVVLRYTRGTLALSFSTSLALGFAAGLFLLELPGMQTEWLAPAFHAVLLGKWPALVACFFVLVRMSVLAPHAERNVDGADAPSHALAYAGGSCWVSALAWAMATLALVLGFAIGVELSHPERFTETKDALLTSLQGDELLRGLLRAMLIGMALGWMVEVESRIDHPWQDDVGTRSMQLIVLGLLLIVVVEVFDAALFWFAGDKT